MSLEAEIRQRLAALAPTQLELIDDSALHAGHAGARAGGKHFRLAIVAPAFAGKNTVARHRLRTAQQGGNAQAEDITRLLRSVAIP